MYIQVCVPTLYACVHAIHTHKLCTKLRLQICKHKKYVWYTTTCMELPPTCPHSLGPVQLIRLQIYVHLLHIQHSFLEREGGQESKGQGLNSGKKQRLTWKNLHENNVSDSRYMYFKQPPFQLWALVYMYIHSLAWSDNSYTCMLLLNWDSERNN